MSTIRTERPTASSACRCVKRFRENAETFPTALENFPNAQSIEIEGSGHVAQVEKPDEFAELVRTFVRESFGAGGAAG
jgi:pimeloyl-ACP methyl ester carboxylesterase